jgi:hypothetical protein
MDIITGALQGVRIRKHTVQFEIDPDVIFTARISPKSKIFKALDEKIVSLIEETESMDPSEARRKNFECIAEANLAEQKSKARFPEAEHTEETEFDNEQWMLAEKFHDTPMAMVAIQVGNNKSELKYLIDSGSTFNLIAVDVAEKLILNGDARQEKSNKDMPVIRIANGKMMEASTKIWLKMYIGEEYTSEVPFYAFGGLPLDAIIGNDLCHQWKAVLSWEKQTWSISTRIEGLD